MIGDADANANATLEYSEFAKLMTLEKYEAFAIRIRMASPTNIAESSDLKAAHTTLDDMEVEMKISNKHGAGFYTRAAAAFLKGTDEKPKVKGLKISALGDAIPTAVAV